MVDSAFTPKKNGHPRNLHHGAPGKGSVCWKFGDSELGNPSFSGSHGKIEGWSNARHYTMEITKPPNYRAEIKPIHGVSCAIYFYLGVIGFRVYPYMHWLTFSRQNIKNMADQPKRTPHPEVRETFIFGLEGNLWLVKPSPDHRGLPPPWLWVQNCEFSSFGVSQKRRGETFSTPHPPSLSSSY